PAHLPGGFAGANRAYPDSLFAEGQGEPLTGHLDLARQGACKLLHGLTSFGTGEHGRLFCGAILRPSPAWTSAGRPDTTDDEPGGPDCLGLPHTTRRPPCERSSW